jgi:hypothetical protein
MPKCEPCGISDAHRDDGKRFVVHADEMLTALLELFSLFNQLSLGRAGNRLQDAV